MLAASAQSSSYFSNELGDLNGLSDNGRYAAIGDLEQGLAYFWDSTNPNVFTDISVDPNETAMMPAAQRVVGTLAYDVTNDGSMVVGTLLYADGHLAGAIRRDGKWTPLPLHEAALNTTEALAVTPDGSVIMGYSFIADKTSEIAGRYYPVQWVRSDDGSYDLVAYTGIKLPDHQGFMPSSQSPDGRVIAGTVYCGVQSNICALVVDGELRIFHELTEKNEPWIYKGKYYCGMDADGKQIWSSDPDDPRIVLFTEYYIDGYKDTEIGLTGAFADCDTHGNFYGQRTIVSNVDADGGGTLKTQACIYNVDTDTWTDAPTLDYYSCGVGDSLLFANSGIVMIDGNKRYVEEEYGIESARSIAGINRVSADGKVFGGMVYEINPATGTYQYFPFVTVTEGASTAIRPTIIGQTEPAFIVAGQKLSVVGADSMEVYDLDGRLVASGTEAEVAPGVYVVRAGGTSAKIAIR